MSAAGSAIPVFGWAIAVGVSQAKHKRPMAKTHRQGRFALRKLTGNILRMYISILPVHAGKCGIWADSPSRRPAIVGDGEWDKNRRMSIGLTYVTHQLVSMKSATERDLT